MNAICPTNTLRTPLIPDGCRILEPEERTAEGDQIWNLLRSEWTTIRRSFHDVKAGTFTCVIRTV